MVARPTVPMGYSSLLFVLGYAIAPAGADRLHHGAIMCAATKATIRAQAPFPPLSSLCEGGPLMAPRYHCLPAATTNKATNRRAQAPLPLPTLMRKLGALTHNAKEPSFEAPPLSPPLVRATTIVAIHKQARDSRLSQVTVVGATVTISPIIKIVM